MKQAMAVITTPVARMLQRLRVPSSKRVLVHEILWIQILSAGIVGAFAIFHGYAHGAELPEATDPLPYVVGFVIATGLLHLIGIAFGLLVRWPAGVYAVRAVGAIIAVLGVAFLIGFA